MTKKELRNTAQNELMSALQTAFSHSALSDELREEMRKQFGRVEKMFGYEPGSWMRGE